MLPGIVHVILASVGHCSLVDIVLLQGVYVPKMHTDITTPRVLIMEWVDGTRLRSSAQGGGGREELQMVEIGVR